MKLSTLKNILLEYELLSSQEEVRTDFEQYLREHYEAVYDEECNFRGYRLILEEGVGYDNKWKGVF